MIYFGFICLQVSSWAAVLDMLRFLCTLKVQQVQQVHMSVLVGLFKKSYNIVAKLQAKFVLYSLLLIRIVPKF